MVERSVSLRLPNERPNVRIGRHGPGRLDHNANLTQLAEMGLTSVGETACSSASAPTLNLAYFGHLGRPSSLHHSRLDLDIEKVSGTLERGSTDHRESVSLPARYKSRLSSRSLSSIFNSSGSGDKLQTKRLQKHGGLHIQPPIEEGEVMSEASRQSEDIKDREQDLNTAIKWLHQEILQMKKQDRALMRRLLEMRSAIHQLAGGVQTSNHNLSASMATLHENDLHPLSADSWPLLGGSPVPPNNREEACDMVQDFHKRVRAVSVVAAMPSGKAAEEFGNSRGSQGQGVQGKSRSGDSIDST